MNEDRLNSLLLAWQEQQSQGHDVPPADLCRDCPELAEELNQRIQVLRQMSALLRSGNVPSGPCTQDANFPEVARNLEADSATRDSASTPWEDRSVPAPAPAAVADYEILEELGRGGMGVVYKARHRRRQTVVALKRLPRQEPSALYRFKHEFRALADMVHPNLVALYELIADGPQWFFTMELVEGADFLTHVRRGRGGGRDPRLRHALRQLAEGVRALHQAGKLHRDIKPSNVLVTPAGRVVLLDFGLAAELGAAGQHQSTEQHLLGTVAYMSPEQAAALPLSPASDWYSVGVVLYESLTDRLPFAGSALQILRAKEEGEPPAPRTVASDVPEDLNRLCVDLLRRDPGARPEGAEVLRRLGGSLGAVPGAFPHLVQPGEPSPLIGRREHLRTLADAFAAVGRGRTVAVALHGRSGSGKSTLLHGFLDSLGEPPEAVILAGRCYEQESVPYKALDGLVDALSRYLGRLSALEVEALLPRDVLSLARVFPVLRRVKTVAAAERGPEVQDLPEVRRRAFAALRELLARLGDRKPLVLVIDDLQWGDVDSAVLLAELLRPPDAPVLLLLAAYRSEDIATSPFLGAFLPALDKAGPGLEARVLTVEGLTAEEARELSLALFGRDDAGARDQAEVIARESGGNPFFVHELVQNLRAGGPSPSGAISLDDVLWARVQRLPEELRRLLETVAVAGGPLDPELAFRVAELDATQPGMIATLRAARLIRSTGSADHNEIETYHDRIRETVVSHLSPAQLQRHHRGLAVALEALSQADPEAIAVHFHGAHELDKAGHYFAVAATKAAAALAFDRAAKLYRLALELRPRAGEEGRRLRSNLGNALANAGRGAEAAREYQAAASGAPAAEALDLQRRAAMHYLISGQVDEGISEVRNVLRAVGLWWPATTRRVLASFLLHRAWLKIRGLGFRERPENEIPAQKLTRIDVSWSVVVGLSRIHTLRGAELQARHLLLALRAGEPFRVARALALEAGHSATTGSPAWHRTVTLLEAARAINRRMPHPHTEGLVTLASGMAEYFVGRWRNALSLCEQAAKSLDEYGIGVMWELNTARAYCLYILSFLGEMAELARRLPPVLRDAEERGNLFVLANHGFLTKPLAQLVADNPEGARQDLDALLGRWSQQGFQAQHFYSLSSHTQIDLYRGNAEGAWNRVIQQWPRLVGSHLLRVQHVRVFSLEFRARSELAMVIKAKDPQPFLHSVARIIRRLEREKVAYAVAFACLLRAGLAAARGDQAGAVPLLKDAVNRLDGIEMRLYAAAARRRLGEILGGDEGRQLLAEADAWLAEQNVRNPLRLVPMLTPGFGGS